MNINQINAKIAELREEQAKVRPGTPGGNLRRYFEIDAQVNELLDAKTRQAPRPTPPTDAQLAAMDYALSDAYDDD